jgi:hypothetical protein
MEKALKSVPSNFKTEIEWLFFYLWTKPTLFRFKIPDTVFIKDGQICNWYFSSNQGNLLKKNKKNLNIFKMSNSFVRKLNTNFEHVSATAYHYDNCSVDSKKNTLTLEHISTHDFRSFCTMLESNN